MTGQSGVDDRCYLGLDVGSSSLKAMLVRSTGEPIGVASSGYETSYPQPGYVEQDADDWYTAACLAVRLLLDKAGVDAARIAGIGQSGTSHVPSLLDQHLRLIRPAILWNDVRSEAQVRRLAHDAGDVIVARARNSINCTWSLAQLAWVRDNEPEAFARVRHVLFSKDYLAFRLTGEMAADSSSAVSSLLVDAEAMQWSDELLRLAALSRDAVAAIHPSTAIVGRLTTVAAANLGVPLGVPVVAGMLDSAAELVGVGATDPSVAVIRLGTAGGVMTLTMAPEWRNGCMLYPHPVQPLWYHQAGTNAATVSLQWARGILGLSERDAGYGEIDALVAQSPAGADGLLFHPYLIGERAPYWSSRIRGGFSGMTIDHGRPALLRAVQEGVAYSLRDCTSLLDWHTVSDIRLCGGGAKSGGWCRIIADILGLPVYQMRQMDASALGAALAAVAGCESTDLSQLALAGAHDSVRIEPDEAHRSVYDAGYRRYREIADQYLRTFERT
jgi:xylulokinase